MITKHLITLGKGLISTNRGQEEPLLNWGRSLLHSFVHKLCLMQDLDTVGDELI